MKFGKCCINDGCRMASCYHPNISFPDKQSHNTKDFMPNLLRLAGMNCLNDNRPLNNIKLSSIQILRNG
ncbi:hypothetical protein ANTRET_LOCUS9464 [Anthophora retusa]